MDEIADMPIDADDLSIEVIKEPQLKNTKDCKQLDKEVEELKTVRLLFDFTVNEKNYL